MSLIETTGKVLRIRRADVCAGCDRYLPAGTEAVWFSHERLVRCTPCSTGETAVVDEPGGPQAQSVVGEAGRAADREYRRRLRREIQQYESEKSAHERWCAEVIERRPIIGRLQVAFRKGPAARPVSQATHNWRLGAIGEQKVAEALARIDGIHVLHDRRLRGQRANIDHIVVAPSGVYVIDAKRYAGRLEVKWPERQSPGTPSIYVNGRRRQKSVNGLSWQVEAVSRALGQHSCPTPVRGVLCFVDGEWVRPPIIRPTAASVVVRPGDLGLLLANGGDVDVSAVAGRLAQELVSA